MKKLVLLIALISPFGCSNDAPTEPTNKYPILHKYLAPELAFKINETRLQRGLQEFKYLPEVEFTKDGQTFDFDTETSLNPDNMFKYYNHYSVINDYDDITIIMKKEFYLKSHENIAESIADYEWFWWYGELSAEEILISINIVEKENTYPQWDDNGSLNGQYGLYKFDVYLYIKRINPMFDN